jgi:hypothetical protein
LFIKIIPFVEGYIKYVLSAMTADMYKSELLANTHFRKVHQFGYMMYVTLVKAQRRKYENEAQ